MNTKARSNTPVRLRLIGKYPLEKTGTWKILGEDPNCDLGGSHVQPFLGIVEGRYSDVIDHALDLPGFFTWGGGGDIEPVYVHKVVPLPTLKERVREVLRGAVPHDLRDAFDDDEGDIWMDMALAAIEEVRKDD